jgi:hypothetical protein
MLDTNKIINNLKNGASIFAGEAESLARGAISKSSDIVDRTKLNFAIKEIENKLNDAYVFIGKYVYEQSKSGAEFTGEVQEKCELINECLNEINELKKEIAISKNAVLCERCGNYVSANSKFCPECGEKIS